MAESLLDRVLRKRRAEDPLWSDEEELQWLRRHPEDRPEGWVDPDERIEFDPDLIPDVPTNNPINDDLEDFLANHDIISCYNRFCGKMQPNPKGRTEGIEISCPDPAHPDNDPSAWINTDKQTWFCGGCQVGGDKFDIYAITRGWENYKPEFHKLRRAMAEELGWTAPIEGFTSANASASESDDPGAPDPISTPLDLPKPTPVVEERKLIILPSSEETKEGLEHFRIDWESIIPPETFLWDWMFSTAMVDDLPHEYYFWDGVQALGFAGGNKVWMPDQRPIKANFNVVNYGRTGSGKSRATSAFVDLIVEALPWTGDEYTESNGVQILHAPGSAEALLKSFTHEILDPATNQFHHLASVRGLLRMEEFASFLAKASRPGGNMKERLIELYDVFTSDVTHYSLSGGKIVARSPFCQMITTTQPKAIHTFTTRNDVESGFLNRWVFAVGPRRRRRMAHGGATIDTRNAALILRRLRDWCDTGLEMPLTGDALKAWESFFYDQVEEMVEHSDESMFSRIDLILKKIILILCINERLDMPTAEIVEKAATLLPYLRHSMGMFSHDISYSQYDDCVLRVVKAVEIIETNRPGKPVTKRDIAKRLKGAFPDRMIVEAMKTANDLGLIGQAISRGGRGRPSEGFVMAK